MQVNYINMEADQATIKDWPKMDFKEMIELQLMALEELFTDVLFSDNVDKFFERYQPLSFLPSLCKIFLNESVSYGVLEKDARAITYYLELLNECSRRVVQVSGALRTISSRLEIDDMSTFCGKFNICVIDFMLLVFIRMGQKITKV